MAITPSESDAPVLGAWFEQLPRDGIDAVQIRRKSSPDTEVLLAARRARTLLGESVALLINGRADLAATVGADGVHLPGNGVPAEVVRHCLGSGALIGRSTHAISEIVAAADEGADYVTFGPVFSTPSKARFGRPVGLEALEHACGIGLPVVALGGITTIERVRDCRNAGAWGIAGIRLFDGAGLDLAAALSLLDR